MEYSFFHMLSQLNYSKITYFLSVFMINPIITFLECFFFLFMLTYHLIIVHLAFKRMEWIIMRGLRQIKFRIWFCWRVCFNKSFDFFLKFCFFLILVIKLFFMIGFTMIDWMLNDLFLMILFFNLRVLKNWQFQHFFLKIWFTVFRNLMQMFMIRN